MQCIHQEYESKKEIIQHLLPWPGEVRAGQVFTWGRGSHGQLGHGLYHPEENCAIPYPVPNLNNVIWVACGGGQQGCTACVTSIGEVLTWGNNSGYRLGHLDENYQRASPKTKTYQTFEGSNNSSGVWIVPYASIVAQRLDLYLGDEQMWEGSFWIRDQRYTTY